MASSSRYTPPTPKEFYESPRWVPILMLALLAIGVLAILSRYVIWDTTNTPVLVGLGFLLGRSLGSHQVAVTELTPL